MILVEVEVKSLFNDPSGETKTDCIDSILVVGDLDVCREHCRVALGDLRGGHWQTARLNRKIGGWHEDRWLRR